MTFRFTGEVCHIFFKTDLKRLGQSVDLAQDEARVVVLGGGSILSASDFDGFGFTESELRDYATPGQRLHAPESFHAKLRAARARVDEIRAAFEAEDTAHRADPSGFEAAAAGEVK